MRRAAVTWGISLVGAVTLTACGPGQPGLQSRAPRPGGGGPAPQTAVVATIPLRDWGTDVTAGPDGRAYVVMRTGRVAIVDATTAKVTAEVEVEGEPYAAVVTPRGRRVYVVDYLGQYISVIDTATATVKRRIPNSTRHRPSLRPSAAVSHDARFVYVADTARDHLVVVRTDDDSVVKDLFLDVHPAAVATRADGRYVYVAGCRLACTDGTLLEIDTTTYAITRRLKLAWVPSGLVVTPDGRRAYVSNGTEGTVSSIAIATQTVNTIPVGPEPVGIAMNDAGTLVYVTSFQAGMLYAIATAGDQMVATADIGKTPRQIAVSPDGSRAFVTSSSALVSIVDLARLRR